MCMQSKDAHTEHAGAKISVRCHEGEREGGWQKEPPTAPRSSSWMSGVGVRCDVVSPCPSRPNSPQPQVHALTSAIGKSWARLLVWGSAAGSIKSNLSRQLLRSSADSAEVQQYSVPAAAAAMSGTLDQNAIREAKLVTSVQRPDGEGEIKLFITSTANAPGAGPGFGYKTVKSKAQIYFYFDPQRFPQGREDPQVASALQRLIDEMPRHPEKFSNCEPINIGTPAGEEIANPDMASVEKRIETFATWPRPEMNAHKLAAAGFFYAPIPGCTDRCIFYASGNALFNWDANDDPWTEYKKWYPQCPHVRKREAARTRESKRVA